MKSWICIFVFLFSACASSPFNGPNPFEHTELLLDAEETIGGLIHASQIPQKLLGHTKAIVVFPNLVKAAMIAGARVEKGVVIVDRRRPENGIRRLLLNPGRPVGEFRPASRKQSWCFW